MKTALPRIVFLACMVICVSASRTILQCRCVKTSKMVNIFHVVNIKVYEPSSYCSRKEVTVLLKDNTSACLDPQAPFTIRLLKAWQKKMKKPRSMAIKTASSTTSATVVQSL
ncbi:C-X-C motif chemokine 3-like [Anabas testudineus]|uniref:C-X-C motif chemokine 3-like n=1 Tax=Anabas testudineus TaxID=64144 RepID=UPI000E45ED46|nr:C-X-C motif chemokine 3-like [Anabas testudineus]